MLWRSEVASVGQASIYEFVSQFDTHRPHHQLEQHALSIQFNLEEIGLDVRFGLYRHVWRIDDAMRIRLARRPFLR